MTNTAIAINDNEPPSIVGQTCGPLTIVADLGMQQVGTRRRRMVQVRRECGHEYPIQHQAFQDSATRRCRFCSALHKEQMAARGSNVVRLFLGRIAPLPMSRYAPVCATIDDRPYATFVDMESAREAVDLWRIHWTAAERHRIGLKVGR